MVSMNTFSRAFLRSMRSRGTSSLQQPSFVSARAFSSDGEFQVETIECASHRIDPPPAMVTTSKEELLDFFTKLFKYRRMEISLDLAYKAKLIRGFCHLYDGQEAVVVGMEKVLNFQDSVITSYRDHCTHLGRGGTVQQVVSELMGKADGGSKGIGGSMHLYHKKNNYYGGCGIVGAQIPLGVGLAFKHKYQGERNVSVTMYGDGAANQGQKYEALNMAALWSLPAIFVCENNHFGMGTAEHRASKSVKFYTRGDYVPGLQVDGMDVLAVKNAFAYAKEYAVENGPIILEMDTYRYHGHSMSDPGTTYRTRDSVQQIRQERDPIERVRKLLVKNGLATPEELKAIELEVRKEVDAAMDHAKAGEIPSPDLLWSNVYKNNSGMQVRSVDPAEWKDLKYVPYELA